MKKIEIHHSEELRDVISKFPTRFNSILTLSLFSILVIFILLGWFIQSPEIMLANVMVTAEKPPVSIVAESNGKIKILEFTPQKQYKEGTVIGVVENLGDERKILRLKDSLVKYQSSLGGLDIRSFDFALSDNLGEIQESYFKFITALHEANNNKNSNEHDLHVSMLKGQIEKYNMLINQRNKLKDYKSKELGILSQKAHDDSVLMSKKMIILNDYENSTLSLYKEKESFKNIDIENTKNKLSIMDAEGNLKLNILQKNLKLSNVELKLLESFKHLILNINSWERKYLIRVPVDGQVDYINFISSNQFVNQGSLLFSVLPDNNKIIGQLLMPGEGAGKVKEGQMVFIKLAAFPYHEFGKLIGRVKSISLIPSNSEYIVIVEIPKGLRSDIGKNLSFGKNMEGQAEIIIQKQRLISKVFNKILRLFDRQPPQKVKNVEKRDNEKNKQ